MIFFIVIRLDAEARSTLASYGSEFAKEIAFRDGWVFLGARSVPGFQAKEMHVKNNKVRALIRNSKFLGVGRI